MKNYTVLPEKRGIETWLTGSALLHDPHFESRHSVHTGGAQSAELTRASTFGRDYTG